MLCVVTIYFPHAELGMLLLSSILTYSSPSHLPTCLLSLGFFSFFFFFLLFNGSFNNIEKIISDFQNSRIEFKRM